MATEFGCVYGLSAQTGDLDKNYAYQVSTQDMTIGVFGGPKSEACWFLFFKVDEDIAKGRGRDTVPTWTFEQGVEICEKYADAKITDTVTFGDIYKNRYRLSAPQACPNHCLKRWTYGRIICMGDSVAKTNPILAQGGAQGAESVLQLIDQLHEALQKQKLQDPTKERLSTIEVEGILMNVNKERQPRVTAFVENSQQIIRISAWSGWVFWFVGKYLTRWLPTSVIVGQALGPWKGAYLSKSLPMPPGQGADIKAH
jgi:2-polyprenyl-6-methoxyphenol hydroxylase-like FAD-dependent oxidoreductase